MPTLTPVLSAFWDDERSWSMDTYEQHDGYQALRQALQTPQADLIELVKQRAAGGGDATHREIRLRGTRDQSHCSAPRFHTYTNPTTRIAMNTSISPKPKNDTCPLGHPVAFDRTAFRR